MSAAPAVAFPQIGPGEEPEEFAARIMPGIVALLKEIGSPSATLFLSRSLMIITLGGSSFGSAQAIWHRRIHWSEETMHAVGDAMMGHLRQIEGLRLYKSTLIQG